MKSYFEMTFYTFDTEQWEEVEMTIQASTKFGCARLFLNNYSGWYGKTNKGIRNKVWRDNLPEEVLLPVVSVKRFRNH